MTKARLIEINDIRANYGNNEVLKGVNLSIDTNNRWAVVGRNGTGKSTLIKTIAALLKPGAGKVSVKGKNVFDYKAKERATLISYVPQKPSGIIPYSVYDYLMLGRYAAMNVFGTPVKEDVEAVEDAAVLCDISDLQNRLMSTLSGGELQRVLLAGAVAQRTPIMLLDEPTTFLDPAHERMFFDALERVHSCRDLTIIMVTHDINSALSHCTNICGLLDGRAAFSGTVEEFRRECPEILVKLFGIPFRRFSSDTGESDVFGAWGTAL